MKIALAAAATLLFFASASRADSNTTVYDVASYVYQPCGLEFCQGPQLFQLQLTTELVTGNFEVGAIGMTLFGTFPVITAMTGTFDGQYPVSMIPAQFENGAQDDDFLLSYDGLFPADVMFMAEGFVVDIEYDDGIMMQQGPPNLVQPGDFLSWDITKVPEPAPLLLSGIGLVGLALFSRLKRTKHPLDDSRPFAS
jgi:hypothetical protein